MRQMKYALTLAATAGLLFPALCPAQRKRPGGRGGGLSSNFARGPAVGEKLPDLTVYDANGKPFRLSRLKGSYTVLVFGCLT